MLDLYRLDEHVENNLFPRGVHVIGTRLINAEEFSAVAFLLPI